jgi:hypothetical protein
MILADMTTEVRLHTREKPATDQVADFIDALRKLRQDAGGPSFRKMAQRAHYSHTAFSSMLSSGRLPSLKLTLAFVSACNGDQDQWRTRWEQTHDRGHADLRQPLDRPHTRHFSLFTFLGAAAAVVVVVIFSVAAASHERLSAIPAIPNILDVAGSSYPPDPAACTPVPVADMNISGYIADLGTVTEPLCAAMPAVSGGRTSGTTQLHNQQVSYYVQRNPNGYVQTQLRHGQETDPDWSVYWQENPPDNSDHPGCSWYQERMNSKKDRLSWQTTGWVCGGR